MAYTPEEIAQVVEIMVDVMKNKGLLDRAENREEFDLITQTGRQDLVQTVADALGLRIESDPSSQLSIYLFPKDDASMFSVTKADVRRMMMRSIPNSESQAAKCNGIAAQACIFCFIVHIFFSSDLAPEFTQQEEISLADLMDGIDRYFTELERGGGDDCEPTPITNVAYYFHSRECTTEGVKLEDDRTRVSTQVGLVKGVLKILDDYGMLDSAALKNSIVRPTRRFACWFGTGIAASSNLLEIEKVFNEYGME